MAGYNKQPPGTYGVHNLLFQKPSFTLEPKFLAPVKI